METKEIKINIPDGYEIDKENSSFECIKLRKVESKFPMNWEEYEQSLTGTIYVYANNRGCSESYYIHGKNPQPNLFESPDRKDVKTFVAFAKLIQLRNAWWRADGNWKPDWTDSKELKHTITSIYNNVRTSFYG